MAINIGTSRLHYVIHGEGVPVVLLHGSRVDHHLMTGCFEPIFACENGYRRIYPDLPGMGQSVPGEGITDDTAIVDVLLQFIDAVVGDERFLLVGESFGGQLARGLIERASDRILGALFLCPYISDIPQTPPPRQVRITDERLMASLPKEQKTMFEAVSVVQTKDTLAAFTADIGAYLHLANNAYIDALGQTLTFDRTRRYLFPVSFITGRQDHWTGYEGAFALLPCYPNASFAVLDCAGHNLQLEQRESFRALVLEWLGRVDN